MSNSLSQYDICKIRRHEAVPIPQLHAAQIVTQNISGYSTCRWCGTEFKEIMVPQQIERGKSD